MSDLIFYVLSSANLKERQKDGVLLPEPDGEGDVLKALFADQVESYCNREFAGEEGTMLLVIQTSRLSVPVHKRTIEGVSIPLIEGPLNVDAIIDKIELEPNESGEFEVEISV